MAGREAVQHADSDAGWRLGRRDSGLNLDPKTQTHRCAHLSDCDSALAPLYVRVNAWPTDAPWGVGRKGEGEHPLVPGPVLHSDTAVGRGRQRFFRVRVRARFRVRFRVRVRVNQGQNQG